MLFSAFSKLFLIFYVKDVMAKVFISKKKVATLHSFL